ncbi:hypothetical protein BK007_03935 [Methanobacterium subterraneum]|uniref:DUF4393 domain-containing protein n=1 Tax=Methanobacterium subterraneum TaxID=59277 RepID=A0A2H4VAW0_9EURY|nr:LPO_1073/Vpar_1526 family protein [Methanobacterium subterraneum]AUB55247.1 hypothetical protein BK007_03935 [Methanobacterium subterraneum]
MVVDPVNIALFSALGGAVATKFVSEAWDLGKNWLDDYFYKHQPVAQENAQKNALDFLVELGNRIQKIEENNEDDSITKEKIINSLSDPDFSALLQNALISSARTSSKDKHNLLAHIVSDRLLANPESLKALISGMVVDVVPHLSSKHLKLLGLMVVVQWKIVPIFHPSNLDASGWTAYLTESISPLIPKEEVTNMDYMHLESVSCIGISVTTRKIEALISPPDELSIQWDVDVFLKENYIGQRLNNIWSNRLKNSYLTSLGGLIGVYVQDGILGTKTDITEVYNRF